MSQRRTKVKLKEIGISLVKKSPLFKNCDQWPFSVPFRIKNDYFFRNNRVFRYYSVEKYCLTDTPLLKVEGSRLWKLSRPLANAEDHLSLGSGSTTFQTKFKTVNFKITWNQGLPEPICCAKSIQNNNYTHQIIFWFPSSSVLTVQSSSKNSVLIQFSPADSFSPR